VDSDASDPSAPVDPWTERIAPGRGVLWQPDPPAPAAPATPARPRIEAGAEAPAAEGATSEDGAGGPATPSVRARRRGRWVLEWVVVLAVALGVAVGIRALVVQTFYIPSASMEPTLMIGDRILVDKLSYRLHDVHRGDVVVFGRPPGERSSEDIKDLVKRVVGLPGETISSADGTVLIDVKPLKEPWLPPDTTTQNLTSFTIPSGDYFVMGDNRSNSQDSRYFGAIPRSLIVGRVVMRIWPISHIGLF
jgi:signal peptidase I